MAVLPLVIAPDPRLKICSQPVEKVTPEIQKLVDDMLDTMYASGGIGLAAVQVGVHKRILVMDIAQREEDGEMGKPAEPMVLINPEIIESSPEISTYEEGCLSFPGQYADVKRPKGVTIRYLDREGNQRLIEADGLLATCVQHEMDHLNGVVFVDHISSVKRDIIIRKLKKVKRLEQKP